MGYLIAFAVVFVLLLMAWGVYQLNHYFRRMAATTKLMEQESSILEKENNQGSRLKKELDFNFKNKNNKDKN